LKTEENKRRVDALKIARQNDDIRAQENRRRAEVLKMERQNDNFKEEERRSNSLRMHNNRSKYKSSID